MNLEKAPVSPVKLPFAANFTEPRVEFPSATPVYSDREQMGLWDPTDMVQPMLMSATSISTNGGDSIGDEAH